MPGRGCGVEGCERPFYGRGWCKLHHQRVSRNGTPGPVEKLLPGNRPRPDADRFWEKVDKTGPCWTWTAATLKCGYGIFSTWRNGKTMTQVAHRWVYESVHGPIAEGLEVDHMCHNRACVNPEHLQAVTATLNNQNRGVVNSNSTTGVRGVSFDKSRGLYAAYAGIGGKTYHAGRFPTIAEAEAAAIALRMHLMSNNLVDRRAG